MKKNASLTAEEKRESHRGRILILAMITPVLFAVDLYVMIQMPQNYAVLVGITILLLAGIYFIVNAIFQEMDEKRDQIRAEYKLILKSQKASYLTVKKVMERLEEIERGSINPADEIITAQKAIAKVTITREKENAEAMLNSNDKVIEKIVALEESVRTSQDTLLEAQRSMIENFVRELRENTVTQQAENSAGEYTDQSLKELRGRQEEILSGMRALEVYIREELMQIQNAVREMQEASIAPALNLRDTEMAEEPEENFDFGVDDLSGVTDFREPDISGEAEESRSRNGFHFEGAGLEEEDINLLDGFDLGDGEVSEESLDFGMSDLTDNTDFEIAETSEEEQGLLDEFDLGTSDVTEEESDLLDEFDLGASDVTEEEPSLLDGFDFGISEELEERENLEDADDLLIGEEFSSGEDLSFGVDLDFEENLMSEEPLGYEELNTAEQPSIDQKSKATEEAAEEIEVIPLEDEIVEDANEIPNLSDTHKMMTPDEIAALIENL
ncbi:MAG: hypothetical protein ACLT3H_08805 [Roseburia sp.]